MTNHVTDNLTIAENERRFIAQELHDHLAQTLLQMNMQVSICRKYLELGFTTETGEELAGLEKQIGKASLQVRQLITDLRLPVSNDGSFESTLNTQIKTHLDRGGPPITLFNPDNIALSGPKKLALTRIIQEALLNIRKHAHASQVKMIFSQTPTRLHLSIADNGVGFDDALVPNPLAEKGGAGIVNMNIRAGTIGGNLDISSQPDKGTTIQVTIPL